VLLATRPQVNRAVTVNSLLPNCAVNRAFFQPTLSHNNQDIMITGILYKPYSPWYFVVKFVRLSIGLALPVTITIRVGRFSIVVIVVDLVLTSTCRVSSQ